MGLLSSILQMQENAPLREAEARLATEKAKYLESKQKILGSYLKKGGILDGQVASSSLPGESVGELQSLIEQQTQNAPPIEPSMRNEPGVGESPLLDKLYNASMGQNTGGQSTDQPQRLSSVLNDPYAAAILAEASGMDMMGAFRGNQTKERNKVLKSQGAQRIAQGDISNNIRAAQFELDQLKHMFNKKKVTWKNKTVEGVQFSVPFLPDGTIAEIEPLRVSGKKAMSGETGGKYNMLKVAKSALADVRGSLIRPDGSVDRVLLGNMTFSTPGTKGRTMAQGMLDALEAKIRIESGAAVPPEEIKRLAKRARPSLFDSDEGIISKLDRLEMFYNGTIEVLDPNKIYSDDIEKFTAKDGKEYVFVPGVAEEDISLPPTALSALEKVGQGVAVTFKNGQTWYLDEKNQPRQMVE